MGCKLYVNFNLLSSGWFIFNLAHATMGDNGKFTDILCII